MKKNYLKLSISITIFLVSQAFYAQTPINASDLNPVSGDIFPYFTVDYISPGEAGLNKTWDFSGMTKLSGAPDATDLNVNTPSAKGLGTVYATSNIVEESQGNGYAMKTSNNTLQISGVFSPGGSIVYSDFEDLLVYPLTLNETHTDTWEGSMKVQNLTLNRKGTTTVTVDGFGTLITPSGTFENVYRVHIEQEYDDSGYSNSHYVNDQYSWFKAGVHSHLAMITDFNVDGNTYYSRGTYLDYKKASLNQLINTQTTIFPNPATDEISIKFNENLSVISKIYVSDLMGNIVFETETNQGNTTKINTKNLAEGLYTVLIKSNNEILSINKFSIANR